MSSLDDLMKETSQQTVESPLVDDSIVNVIVYGITFPNQYLRFIEDENRKIAEESQLTGIDMKLKEPSFKEGGVAAQIAVLNNNSTNEVYIHDSPESDLVIVPAGVIGEIDMMTLPGISASQIGDMYRLGGSDKFSGDKLKTWNMFPSSRTSSYIIEQKIKNNETVTDDDKRKIELDWTERKTKWKELCELWKKLTEAEALNFCMDRLARRFMLYSQKLDEIKYSLHEGMIFRAKVKKKEGSKYLRLNVLEWSRQGGNWIVQNYNDFSYDVPESGEKRSYLLNDTTKKLAQKIQNALS